MGSMDSIISAEKIKSTLVLKMQVPRVDMMLARRFRDELRQHLSEKPLRIVLDMEIVTHFDSSGMGALKGFMEEVRQTGSQLILCNLNRSMQMLLKLSQMEAFFEVSDDLTRSVI